MAVSSDNKNVVENFWGIVDSIFGPILPLKTDVKTPPYSAPPAVNTNDQLVQVKQIASKRVGDAVLRAQQAADRASAVANDVVQLVVRAQDPDRATAAAEAEAAAKAERARAAAEAAAEAEAEAEAERAKARAPHERRVHFADAVADPAPAPAKAPARAAAQKARAAAKAERARAAAEAEKARAVAAARAQAPAEAERARAAAERARAAAERARAPSAEELSKVCEERNRKFIVLEEYFEKIDKEKTQEEERGRQNTIVQELFSKFEYPGGNILSSSPQAHITDSIVIPMNFFARLESEKPEIRIKFYLKLISIDNEYIKNNELNPPSHEELRLKGKRIEEYKDHAIDLLEDYKNQNEQDRKQAALGKMASAPLAAVADEAEAEAERAAAAAEAGVQAMRATVEQARAAAAAKAEQARAPALSLRNFSSLYVWLRKLYDPEYLTQEEEELELKANTELLSNNENLATTRKTNKSSKNTNLKLEEDRAKEQKKLQKNRDDRDELIKLLESFFDEKNQFKQEFIVDGKFKVRDEEKYKKQKNYVNKLIEDEIELALNKETSSTPLREQLSGNLKSKYLKTYELTGRKGFIREFRTEGGKFSLLKISEEDRAKIVENAQEFFYDDRLRMLLQKDLHLLKIKKVIDEFKQKNPNNRHLGFQERESYREGESGFKSGINYLLDQFEDFKEEKSCRIEDADSVISQLTEISDSYESLGNDSVKKEKSASENIRIKNIRLKKLISEQNKTLGPSSESEIKIIALEDDIMEIYKENKGKLDYKKPAEDIIERREAELKKLKEKKSNIDKKIEALQPKKTKTKRKAISISEPEPEPEPEPKAKALKSQNKFHEIFNVLPGKVSRFFKESLDAMKPLNILYKQQKDLSREICEHSKKIQDYKSWIQEERVANAAEEVRDKNGTKEQRVKNWLEKWGAERWLENGEVENWLKNQRVKNWLEKGGGAKVVGVEGVKMRLNGLRGIEKEPHSLSQLDAAKLVPAPCMPLKNFNKNTPSEESGLLSTRDVGGGVPVPSARPLALLGILPSHESKSR